MIITGGRFSNYSASTKIYLICTIYTGLLYNIMVDIYPYPILHMMDILMLLLGKYTNYLLFTWYNFFITNSKFIISCECDK